MEPIAISLGWVEVVKIVIGTGGTSVFLSVILPWWSKRRRDQQEATYLAMRLAVILELYAVEINDLLIGINFHKAAMGDFPSNRDFKFPDLEDYPDCDSWKVLPAKLADRALSFSTVIRLGKQGLISAESCYCMHNDKEEWYADKCNAMAEVALYAFSAAVELRAKYKLEEFAKEWDISKSLSSFQK